MKNSFIQILGITQDGGYPQCGCFNPKCCQKFSKNDKTISSLARTPSCIGIYDSTIKKLFLIDLTLSLPKQLYNFKERIKNYIIGEDKVLQGVILTHAHIGHYGGMLYMGKEIMNCQKLDFYLMPKMNQFLKKNEPFRSILKENNVIELKNDCVMKISDEISFIPFIVPHRDEFSETVGVKVIGNETKMLYIPDIDCWDQWNKNIIDEIKNVDYAFIDGTFYQDGEIERDMSLIKHPRILQSLKRFETMDIKEKKKIYFIHLNHSNICLDENSEEYKLVYKKGFNIAKENSVIKF